MTSIARLAYDDERTVHSEDGRFVWFPVELSTRGSAIAEVIAMSGGLAGFRELTASKVYLALAPPDEVPAGYDSWWHVVNRRHPNATAFWEVRGVGEQRSCEPELDPGLDALGVES